MIRIQYASEVEKEFFAPRSFSGSAETVKAVIEDVKKRGDPALRDYAKKFDAASPASFLLPEDELRAAAEKLKRERIALYDALSYSFDSALRFAKKQKESFSDFEVELEPGVFTGQKTIPVENAGAYIPAGRFPLVSTVVMTASPALAAGVKNLVICTPPRVHPNDMREAERSGTGKAGKPFVGGAPYADEGIMAAAFICGVKTVFACGGAQAVAAMAFGTESIPAVDVIVGPGNTFVAAAKKEVYGTVGIDMLAGPTEVFIIADSSADPAWLAADLLAQAEHDPVAQPVLVTPDGKFAERVAAEIEAQLASLPTRATAEASISSCGRIIITGSLEEAAELANRKAPEHLELAVSEGSECDKLISLVHNYGSLFIGHYAAEVFGDYAAGLNHTLPTSGSARFTGGLSVRTFLKTVTTLRCEKGREGMKRCAEAAACLGDAEGLAAHARAARLRLKN